MNRGWRAFLTFVRHRGPVDVHSPHRDRDLEFKDKTPSTMLGQHSLIYSANASVEMFSVFALTPAPPHLVLLNFRCEELILGLELPLQ